MRILIRPRNMSSDTELRDRVDQCLETALDPVRPYLEGVDVYLTDVNGPRGGPDKHCRLVAYVPSGPPVVVSYRNSDPVTAVARAAARVRQSVRSHYQRRRTLGRPARWSR